MARRDYHAVLGVPRDATPEEIKRAFRALALRYHPDRNPDSPEAEARFREIVEAYEVLSDPVERARYERLGPLYRRDGRPPTPEDLNVALQEALDGLFGRRRPPRRGEDLEATVRVTIDEVAAGTERVVEVTRRVRCRRCKGDGADPDGGRRACERCGGSGRLRRRGLFRPRCPACRGAGTVVARTCERCGGEGREGRAERLRVRVPAGVAAGQRLKVRGRGNDSPDGGPPGDLYVVVEVEPHPLLERRGEDLWCELPLLWSEAVLGAELPVPVPGGRATIRVPPGTPSGTVFRLAGRGLPALDGRRRGDLHVRVTVDVPEALDPAQRALVERLAARIGPSAHPRRRAWQAGLDGHPDEAR